MAIIAVAAFLVPLALSWGLTRGMIAWAPTVGLVDHPDARKAHAKSTPLGGGVAIYLAVILSLVGVLALAALVEHWPAFADWLPSLARLHAKGVLSKAPMLGLLIATGATQMLLGLADDWRKGGLDYRVRLAGEAGLVAILMTQGVELSIFIDSHWVTAPLTILWIVGLTNALNFLDNMDGLSAGVALWASAFFAGVMTLVGDLFVAGCFYVMLGALLGFLRWNWSPAKIFMGDAGSNFLGFWLGALTVIGTFHTAEQSHVTVFAPLCILATPIYDSMTVIALRIAEGRSPFQPDRRHFSHRLVDLGFSKVQAVRMIYLLCATTGVAGVLLYFVEPRATPLALLQVLGSLALIGLLEKVAAKRNSEPSP